MSDLGHQSPQTILVKKMDKIPVTETPTLNTFTDRITWICNQTSPLNGKMTTNLSKAYHGKKSNTLKPMCGETKFLMDFLK